MADYDSALYVGRYKLNQDVLVDGESSEAMLDINSRVHSRISREYMGIARDLDLLKHGEGILGASDYPYLDSEVIGIAAMAYTETNPTAVDNGDATALLADHYGRLQVNLERGDYGVGTARRALDIQEIDSAFASMGIGLMGRVNSTLGLTVNAQGDAIPIATDIYGRVLMVEATTSNTEYHIYGTVTNVAINETKVVVVKSAVNNVGPEDVLQADQFGASCTDMCKVQVIRRTGAALPAQAATYVPDLINDTILGTWFISGAAANANIDVTWSHSQEVNYVAGTEGFFVTMMPMKHAVDVYAYINGHDA